jgi:hypothetical protein
MKRRIIKKHNNTESGKRAPEYAKGVKVYELGFYSNTPRTSQMSPTNIKDTNWFMCYSTKPVSSHRTEYYNLVKKCRTAHPYSELISGEIEQYYGH